VSLQASQLYQEFGGFNPHDVELFTLGGSIVSRLTDRYRVSAGVDYRDEEDTLFGGTEGFQLNAELRYDYRKFSLRTGIEVDLLERNESETNSTLFYLRVKRFF
jgi:hypothetical protein